MTLKGYDLHDQDFKNNLHKSLWTKNINFHTALVPNKGNGILRSSLSMAGYPFIALYWLPSPSFING